MFLVLWLALQAQASCDQILNIALNHAEKSFATGDASGVEGGSRDARKAIDCVDKPISAETAARIHRTEALAAHMKDNATRTDAALAAMVHADPWLGVSDLVAHGHPLAVRLVYVEEKGAGATRNLLWPEKGRLHVDGIPAAIAPSQQPWVYQQLTDEGTVLRSAWVDVAGGPPPVVGEVGERAQIRNGWKLTGVTLGLVGAGLGVGAFSERQRFQRALVAQDPVATRDAESMSNALTVGAIVTGAAGVSLVVVGFAI